ncbi:MAG: NAD(P)/FAD-dependent oxidoreductase [Bacteroidetes bacterium]|nr:NAD(P)/FAD-dependent oxidoreductase [Bacteroidota bacterium]
MEKFDLCVIGAGPSGYAAAMRAVDFKKKVLLIEKKRVGGAGIHNGALSSKTWWELSREHLLFRKNLASHGMPVPDVQFKDIREEVKSAVGERMNLLENHMRLLNNSDKIQLFHSANGEAKLISENEVEIHTDIGTSVIYADYIILATGSRPRKLPDIPIDEKIIFTSDSVEKNDHFPKSMVILGAGVIGCEFATIFSNFGKTKVNLIDKGDRILPFEDEDVVKVIEKNLESKGVLIHHNARLIRMGKVNGRVEYELEYTNKEKEIFNVEKALISVGRVPNFEDLWTDQVKIKMDSRGIIDKETQTSVPNIYAVGDITADIALVNVGELEGRHAVERIFGKPKRKLIYENVSTIMFLHPEVAGVGLNELQAKEKVKNYKVVSLDYACISRAIAMRNTQGFIKILVTDDDKMKILGMRVVGEHASSAIEAVALLISMNKGIDELAELIHPHPSIIEGIQECVRMLLGKSMLKPSILKDYMVCRTCHNGVYEDIKF